MPREPPLPRHVSESNPFTLRGGGGSSDNGAAHAAHRPLSAPEAGAAKAPAPRALAMTRSSIDQVQRTVRRSPWWWQGCENPLPFLHESAFLYRMDPLRPLSHMDIKGYTQRLRQCSASDCAAFLYDPATSEMEEPTQPHSPTSLRSTGALAAAPPPSEQLLAVGGMTREHPSAQRVGEPVPSGTHSPTQKKPAQYSYGERYVRSFGVTQVLEGHTGCVNSIEFSTDGLRLLSGSDDLTLRVYDTVTWKSLQQCRTMHSANIFHAVFSPYSASGVLSCGLDGRTLMTDIETSQTFFRCRYPGMASSIVVLPGMPSTAYVAYGQGQIVRVDTRLSDSPGLVYAASPLSSRNRECSVNALAVHPSHPYLIASAMESPSAFLHDARMSSLGPFARLTIPGVSSSSSRGIGGISFSERGDFLAVNMKENDIYVAAWQQDMAACLFQAPTAPESLSTRRRDRRRRTGLVDAGAQLSTEPATGSMYSAFDSHNVACQPFALNSAVRLRGRLNSMTMFKEVGFMLNDEVVFSGGDCGNLFFWRRRDGKLLHKVGADSDVVNGVRHHPSLPVVAAAGIDNTVKVLASCGDLSKSNDSAPTLGRHATRANFWRVIGNILQPDNEPSSEGDSSASDSPDGMPSSNTSGTASAYSDQPHFGVPRGRADEAERMEARRRWRERRYLLRGVGLDSRGSEGQNSDVDSEVASSRDSGSLSEDAAHLASMRRSALEYCTRTQSTEALSVHTRSPLPALELVLRSLNRARDQSTDSVMAMEEGSDSPAPEENLSGSDGFGGAEFIVLDSDDDSSSHEEEDIAVPSTSGSESGLSTAIRSPGGEASGHELSSTSASSSGIYSSASRSGRRRARRRSQSPGDGSVPVAIEGTLPQSISLTGDTMMMALPQLQSLLSSLDGRDTSPATRALFVRAVIAIFEQYDGALPNRASSEMQGRLNVVLTRSPERQRRTTETPQVLELYFSALRHVLNVIDRNFRLWRCAVTNERVQLLNWERCRWAGHCNADRRAGMAGAADASGAATPRSGLPRPGSRSVESEGPDARHAASDASAREFDDDVPEVFQPRIYGEATQFEGVVMRDRLSVLLMILDVLLQAKEELCSNAEQRKQYWIARCAYLMRRVYFYMALGNRDGAMACAMYLDRDVEFQHIVALGAVPRDRQRTTRPRRRSTPGRQRTATRRVGPPRLARADSRVVVAGSEESPLRVPLLVPLAMQLRIAVLSARAGNQSSRTPSHGTGSPERLVREATPSDGVHREPYADRHDDGEQQQQIQLLRAELLLRLIGHPNLRVKRRVERMIAELDR